MSVFVQPRKNGTDDWRTPKWIYDRLDREFHFNDDACPLNDIKNGTGLLREWGSVTFMNPPYSSPAKWCEKAVIESRKGKTVVGLLKGDTSTKWFHKYVLPYCKGDDLRFIKGRLRFSDSHKPAPFPSIIAVWRGSMT